MNDNFQSSLSGSLPLGSGERRDYRLRTVLPTIDNLTKARQNLIQTLPANGLGEQAVLDHIRNDIGPALNASSQSPNYYGFVTGGTTPMAQTADNIVTEYDQNVGVHLPNETIATDIDDRALSLLCELLDFNPAEWKHRIFTTGATASNVLGLACGRQFIVEQAARRVDPDLEVSKVNVGQVGISNALRNANLEGIQILTTVPHSSLLKASSIVGLGRDAVKLVGQVDKSYKFDMSLLEQKLAESRVASIVSVSCGDVNTGFYATTGEEMETIRALCDKNDAWIHVDGAFGLMARLLDLESPDHAELASGVANIHLADSITGDGHKLLNVPYDCGFFFSRHARIGYETFQNQGAAYLSTGPLDENAIISSMHMGIENSRRFRALPVYASLSAYGKKGYREMLERQIQLSKRIAALIALHEGYELLPAENSVERTFMIVLFKARDSSLNAQLVKRINASLKVYVSGTAWNGEPACRFAVSNWQVDVERDVKIIEEVLDDVHKQH